MTSVDDTFSLPRRGFMRLLLASVTGGFALGSLPRPSVAAPNREQPRASRGYQDSAHVQAYYRSARF